MALFKVKCFLTAIIKTKSQLRADHVYLLVSFRPFRWLTQRKKSTQIYILTLNAYAIFAGKRKAKMPRMGSRRSWTLANGITRDKAWNTAREIPRLIWMRSPNINEGDIKISITQPNHVPFQFHVYNAPVNELDIDNPVILWPSKY